MFKVMETFKSHFRQKGNPTVSTILKPFNPR